MTMKRKLNNDNGLQDCKTEHQAVTAVWRNGGSHGKLNGSNSNKLFWWLDSEVLLNPPLRQAANRWAQTKKISNNRIIN